MTSLTTRAAMTALLIGVSAFALSAPADAQATRASKAAAANAGKPDPNAPKVSPRVATELQAAQKSAGSKDFKSALTSVQKAQAVSGLTDYDNLKINQFLVFVNLNLGDQAAATAAAEAAADLPNIPEAEKHDVMLNGTVLALNAKHYDKALKYAKEMEALGLNDAKARQVIGQAYYLSGDYEGAKALAQKQIAADVAAGQKPSHQDLEIVLSAQARAKDEPGAQKTLEDLVTYWNDPKDWQQMTDIALSTPGMRDVDVIYLGRLILAVGIPLSKSNADLVGGVASQLTFFGDAVTATKSGGSGFPNPVPRADADKKTIPQQITAGASQNGQYNVKLAEALYGYEMYPEAEAAARLAVTKGGATNASEPPMVLGMTLVQQGKYAEAATTFGQVRGGGPATARIARLWAALAKNKANPPAPPATQAAAAAQ